MLGNSSKGKIKKCLNDLRDYYHERKRETSKIQQESCNLLCHLGVP